MRRSGLCAVRLSVRRVRPCQRAAHMRLQHAVDKADQLARRDIDLAQQAVLHQPDQRAHIEAAEQLDLPPVQPAGNGLHRVPRDGVQVGLEKALGYRVAFSCCIMRFSTVILRFVVATLRYVHHRKNPRRVWKKRKTPEDSGVFYLSKGTTFHTVRRK